MKLSIICAAIAIFLTAQTAVAELCFYKVVIKQGRTCPSNAADKTCEQLCFEGEYAGGVSGSKTYLCSTVQKNLQTEQADLLKEVKDIFSSSKQVTGGKLNYCTEQFQSYQAFPEIFTAEFFLSFIKNEEQLKQQKSLETLDLRPIDITTGEIVE